VINPFSNPSYLLPPLVVVSIIIALVILVWKRGRRDFSSQLFIAFLVMLGMWAVFTFAMRSSDDIHQALPWEKALVMAAVSAFAVYYHFTLAYTNIRAKRWSIPALYSSILAFAILLTTTDLAIQGMRLADYGYAPITGPLGPLFFAPAVLLVIGGAYNLLKRYKASTLYEKRNRLIYLMVATLFPLIGAALDAFSDLPPVAIWSNLLFCTVCTIAILKYHLLDIRVVARKSLTYLFVSSVVAIPYVGALFLLIRLLKTPLELWWVHGLIIILLALALRPLYSWAQRSVDRLFYRDRYDYLRALEQFGKQAQSISDLEGLGSTVVKLMSGALHTSNASLLLTSQENGGLAVMSTVGLDNPPSRVVLKKESLLVGWLRLHDDIVCSKELSVIIQLQNLTRLERQNLEKLQAELYVPIKAREGELSGLLTLGEKLSHQTYSDEDRRLLSTIARQIAVSLENASLYREVRLSEIALRESEEKLRLMFESITAGIVVYDLRANIVQVNEAVLRMHGYDSKEELIGRSAIELIAKKDRAKAIKNMKRLLEDGYVKNVEYTLLREDGSKFNAEVSATVMRDASGNPTAFVAVTEDITERKQIEVQKREMEQKAQLASRLASVGEMASGIAHEINNPLTGVIGFAHLLMRKDIPEDTRKYVQAIHNGAQRVADIVTRLLTFARQRKPSRTSVNINEILENTLALRAYEMQTSNIEVTAQLASYLPRTVADAGQLQEVFLNIIINAETEMKLAHSRGKLSVKTETLDNSIRISFEDDGPGIVEENLKKIFDPFFTTREVGKGTGLGLSLCHAIVAEHNGQIYAKSRLGEGATFVVELPIVSEEKESEPPGLAADVLERASKVRILVVDDEPAVQQLLSEILTDEGHEVETVDNGTDALRMIESKCYSLILLDIKLPGMSGIELYKRVEQTAQFLASRVVFITGDVMGANTSDFFSKSKACYITKPFDTQQLKKEINRILGENK